jgi:glutamate formiminotransferase / 5-formyltetrahydrofolate cyclo-ligase
VVSGAAASSPMSAFPLLAVPNVSEGRDPAAVDAIAQAFTLGGAARLLDSHADADHHRAVITLAGRSGSLADALAAGAAEAVRRIDIGKSADGEHPYVGAVDVVPVVYLDPAQRGAACAEALVAAELIGELGVPVFVYGELAGADREPPRTRAELRRGGTAGLADRMRAGELRPDFGPQAPHPTAGATLVAARPPLVAFNLELAPPATVEDARRIAGLVREGGAEGLPGVRAIGVALRRGPAAGEQAEDLVVPGAQRATAQVSMNVERPVEVPLREVVEAVRRHAEVACAELVGLASAAAWEGFPADLPVPGFDPARHVIENALLDWEHGCLRDGARGGPRTH